MTMTPFVLLGRRRLPTELRPSTRHMYDERQQLWIDQESGLPLVASNRSRSSRFGETTITETREGTDQSEVADLSASRFGETTITKTQEGTDQIETSPAYASQFGETTITRTREGTDQQEHHALSVSRFGETQHTATMEGIDSSETATETISDASYSHF